MVAMESYLTLVIGYFLGVFTEEFRRWRDRRAHLKRVRTELEYWIEGYRLVWNNFVSNPSRASAEVNALYNQVREIANRILQTMSYNAGVLPRGLAKDVTGFAFGIMGIVTGASRGEDLAEEANTILPKLGRNAH